MSEKFYQPLYKHHNQMKLLTSFRYDLLYISNFDPNFEFERICLDRLIMISRDLYLLGIKPPATLLDLGCNIGFFSHSFAALGYNVTGLDNNIAQEVQGFSKVKPLDFANELKLRYQTKVNFITGDLIDYLNNCPKYDTVLFLNILHHFFQGYASQGVKSLNIESIQELLTLLSDKTNKVLYFEINEEFAKDYGWRREDIPDLVILNSKFKSVTAVGMTVGAGGDFRNVYRCEK